MGLEVVCKPCFGHLDIWLLWLLWLLNIAIHSFSSHKTSNWIFRHLFIMRLKLLTVLASTVSGLLPTLENRFIEEDDGSVKYVSDYTEDDGSSSTSVKTIGIATTDDDLYAIDTVQRDASSPVILNLIPGISLLQTDQNHECYFVNTTIGTSVFPLIVDTGSAYLWVYGDDCQQELCQAASVYTPSASSASTSTETFALAYVTGTASGEVVQDNIIVNRLATTEQFRFGVADQVPDFFASYPVSGIFGLPSSDSSSIESIISALYDSNAIASKRFSIALGEVGISQENSSSEFNNAGIFAIGEPIEELYTGEIKYSSLLNDAGTYWKIQIEQVVIGDTLVQFNESDTINGVESTIARAAIVDSGTTVLALPEQDALDLHTFFELSITDGTNFAVLCNSTLNINLQLNGHNWTLTADEYLGDPYATDSPFYGYCVSNIQGIQGMESWILGAVFLKTVYADFNLEEQEVGFATRNDNVILTSTETSSSSSVTSQAYYGNVTEVQSSLVTSTSTASQTTSSSTYRGEGLALTVTLPTIFVSVLAFLL